MITIIWNFDPTLFSLGPLQPRWYGLCFALAILIGYQLMRYFYLKEGKSEELLNRGFVLFVIGTIVGARLGHCLFYEPDYYLSNPLKILAVWEGGLASHGGVIGILICMAIYVQTSKGQLNFLWLADRLGIACPLGVPFIRLGNFFNSEIIGIPASVPWAVVFKRVDDIPRHPAQLYEALAYIMIFCVLFVVYKIYRAKPLREGKLIGLMFIGIFTARFFIEFVKENQSDFEAYMLFNMGQLLSIPFILLGIFFFFGGYQKIINILMYYNKLVLAHNKVTYHKHISRKNIRHNKK